MGSFIEENIQNITDAQENANQGENPCAPSSWSYVKSCGEENIMTNGVLEYAVSSESEDDFEMDSIIRLGSLSKIVGTVGLMKMVERGQVSTNDELKDFIPEFENTKVIEKYEPVRSFEILNEFTVENNSDIVRVHYHDHRLRSGDYVGIEGVVNPLQGIPVSEINTVHEIIVLNDHNFTFRTDTTASLDAHRFGGYATVRVLEEGVCVTTYDDTIYYYKKNDLERPITIYHILTQTLGYSWQLNNNDSCLDPELEELRNIQCGIYQQEQLPTRQVDSESFPLNSNNVQEWAKALAEIPLLFQPGSNWCNGIAISILGAVIELLDDDRTIEDYLNEEIFEQLDMEDTGFFIQNGDPNRAEKLSRVQRLYVQKSKTLVTDLPERAHFENWFYDQNRTKTLALLDSGLYSTVDNLKKLLCSLLKCEILTAGSVNMMRNAHVEELNNKCLDNLKWGLGWGVYNDVVSLDLVNSDSICGDCDLFGNQYLVDFCNNRVVIAGYQSFLNENPDKSKILAATMSILDKNGCSNCSGCHTTCKINCCSQCEHLVGGNNSGENPSQEGPEGPEWTVPQVPSLVLDPLACAGSNVPINYTHIGSIPLSGIKLDKSGTYKLSQNVYWNSGKNGSAAIVISSDNVTLDLNNLCLNLSSGSQYLCTFGIIVMPNLRNVRIINGSVNHFGIYGIVIANGSCDLSISNVALAHNGWCGSYLNDDIPSASPKFDKRSGAILLIGEENSVIKKVELKNLRICDSASLNTHVAISSYYASDLFVDGITFDNLTSLSDLETNLHYSTVVGLLSYNSDISIIENVEYLRNGHGENNNCYVNIGILEMANTGKCVIDNVNICNNQASGMLIGVETGSSFSNSVNTKVSNCSFNSNCITNETDSIESVDPLFICGFSLHNNFIISDCEVNNNKYLANSPDFGEALPIGLYGFNFVNYDHSVANNCYALNNCATSGWCNSFTVGYIDNYLDENPEGNCLTYNNCHSKGNKSENNRAISFGAPVPEFTHSELHNITFNNCSSINNSGSIESCGILMNFMKNMIANKCKCRGNTLGFCNVDNLELFEDPISEIGERNVLRECSATNNQTGFLESDNNVNNIYLQNVSGENYVENFDGDWFVTSVTPIETWNIGTPVPPQTTMFTNISVNLLPVV